MGTFHILTDVVFVGSDNYQLKAAKRKNLFLYSKTDSVPFWLDIKNCSSSFHSVILSEEFDCGRKYEEQKNV